MPNLPPRIFLLSPARLDGKRAQILFHPVTMFPVARALHSPAGATIGEIFTFLSGLYFRGKLAYADAFAISTALEFKARLVTGDPEIRTVQNSTDLDVLWLPQRSR